MSIYTVKIQMVADLRGHTRCHYCRRETNTKQNSPLQRTLEHIVPKGRGGSDFVSNLTIACRKCNEERGSKMFFHKCKKCDRIINEFLESRKTNA